ncbi:MAG: hypothetical protein KPEEDBHJ_00934 [Anaerolineales bacterium]|nr:hypothetical protein [Anaerolineales bacterium]
MKSLTRLFHLFIVCALFLGACNLPSGKSDDGAEVSGTFAAQTVEALLMTATVTSTSAPSAAPATNTPAPTNTNTPAPTATPVCPQAQFVTDVTIPDGTEMNPGQTFTKKWRIRNTGTCAWSGYSLVFDSGDSMGGPASQPIGAVNPGQEVDLEVNLTAPTSAGNYRGYWRIVSNSNVLVPMLNGYQGRAFYVDIKVKAPAAPTATNTPVPPAFAVTSVNYSLGTWGDGVSTINCPRVTASITTNGAGTVTFKWKRQDSPGGGATQTLNFAAAGTQNVNYDWQRGSTWAGTATWVSVYIETPNNQDFSQFNFSTACTTP